MAKYGELRENQWRTSYELKQLQKFKLKRLLVHAYQHVPYYRDLFDFAGFDPFRTDCLENFRLIPLLDKAEINENRDRLIADNACKNTLIVNSTSGSTGEALHFYTDMHSWGWRRAAGMRNHEWLGIGIGDRAASLWGASMDLEKRQALRGRLHGWITNSVVLSSYDLSEQKMAEYVEKLNSFKPLLLTSYPGPLSLFSEYLLKTGNRIPSITAIISSAETLFPWQLEIIEKAFGCRVYNRYGCREFGEIAQECERREGLHVCMDRVLIEVLDENNNYAEPDCPGEMVVTDLDNFGMPFIRYRIGDTGAFSKNECSCGRGLRLLAGVEGRTLDIVRTSNGNALGGTFWTLLFKSKPGIKAFQVLQESVDGITVKYVRDPREPPPPLDLFVKRIQEKCGSGFNVRFSEVSEIPTTSSGKTRYVVSGVKGR